jgi:hypothetical protein
MDYFIITSGEDGTSIEGPLVVEQAQSRIHDMIDGVDPENHPVFLEAIPDSDGSCWIAPENSVVLIRGEIIVPKPQEVVTQYKLE